MSEVSNEALVMQALSAECFVLVNKKIMRFFKGDGSAAVFLSELLSAYKYHINNQTIEPDGAFPIPMKRFELILSLSTYKQARILETFASHGLADTRLMGWPAIKYVRLDFDNIAHILSSDELEFKQASKQDFYTKINEEANKADCYKKDLTALDNACDNMMPVLKGTLMLISQKCVEDGREVKWTPELLGRIRTWVGRRSMGKAFDFSIIERTLKIMKVLPNTSFRKFIGEFISSAKEVQDNHFSSQVHDFTLYFPPEAVANIGKALVY